MESKKGKIFLKKFNNMLDAYEEIELIGNFIRFYISEYNFIDISIKELKLSIRSTEILKILPKTTNAIIIEQEPMFIE